MHHSKKAFTILECVISLAVLAMIAFLTHTLLFRSWQFCTNRSQHCFAVMELYAAHDAMVHDMRWAPGDKTLWKRYEPRELVWSISDKDIGYSVSKDNALIRTEGKFNMTEKKWHNAVKSTLAKAITNLTFTRSSDKHFIQSISFDLKNHVCEISQCVHLMNVSMT